MQKCLKSKVELPFIGGLAFLLGERSNHEKATRTIFFIVIDRLQ